jgi:hypothetical protein
MALLRDRLPSVRRPVTLDGLSGFRAALVTNSRTIAPVVAVDGVRFPVDEELMERVHAAYRAVEGEPVTG